MLNEFSKVINEEDAAKVKCMGKCTESKKRPMIIAIKTQEKKKDIFQNLQKLRTSVKTSLKPMT